MLNMVDTGGTKGIPIETNLLLYYKANGWAYDGSRGTVDHTLTGAKVTPPELTEFPLGLKMISGDATQTTGVNNGGFRCHFRDTDFDMTIDPNTGLEHDSKTIPTFCPQKATVPAYTDGNGNFHAAEPNHTMDIWGDVPFGQCWNGQLDTGPGGNHRDHIDGQHDEAPWGRDPVSGIRDPERPRGCRGTHPYILVQVTLKPEWPMPVGGATNYTLASDAYTIDSVTKTLKPGVSRGFSNHGDLMMGWSPEIVHRWHTNCMLSNVRRDCGTGGLGDNYRLDGSTNGSDGTHRGNP